MECTVLQVIGGIMLGIFFLCILITMVKDLGWRDTLIGIDFIIVLLSWIFGAMYLLEACK